MASKEPLGNSTWMMPIEWTGIKYVPNQTPNGFPINFAVQEDVQQLLETNKENLLKMNTRERAQAILQVILKEWGKGQPLISILSGAESLPSEDNTPKAKAFRHRAPKFKYLCECLNIPCSMYVRMAKNGPTGHSWNYIQDEFGKW
eukprot:CAMPEP_0114579054 /NCGR_PEP_ID=MMETSP0125-20121206/3505_1 /TAXON_ID=485358 ORGANISM="Aristerostoma sp., Strain ATCC 50986" /NCGR_SAMPLE_ID=MMETSP0125 /ASSEMBLY_ACC=CAM_ASM_000245 /LENGTH=145 /DNA_ID=CAMNT_0001769563 /DNA_START=181 /DNA_END=615 /DNA_ORIENTATION=-